MKTVKTITSADGLYRSLVLQELSGAYYAQSYWLDIDSGNWVKFRPILGPYNSLETAELEAYEEESDWYANSFLNFMRDLQNLAYPSEKQCEENQHYNVAWELKNFFIGSAEIVLQLPGGELSDEQKRGIRDLLAEVTAIPDAVVMVKNLKAEHLRAMNNPCWMKIREQAQVLIQLLESEMKRTNKILWPTK